MKKIGRIFLLMALIMAMCLGNTPAATIEGDTYEDPPNVIETVSVYKNQEKSSSLSIVNSWGREPGYGTDKTIIGGTALKFNMRVSAKAGPNEFFFKQVERKETDENGNVTAEIFKMHDISGLKETGYLRMLVYPETELTDFAGEVKFVLYDGDRANKSSKQSNIVSIKNQLTLNKWNLVKIPVASFANDSIDLSRISRILFQSLGDYEENSLTYYVQNIGFCDEMGLNITAAEYTDGSVNLAWTPKAVTPAQYSVKCNGDEIAKTAETAYSYVPTEKGEILEYTVDALNENGAVICTSGAKSLYIDDPKTITVASVYKDSKPDTLTILTLSNWGYPAYTDENTIIGGKAIKWSMRAEAGNQLKMELNPTIDASAAEENGYLSMLVYPKTELETLPGNISVFYYGNGKDTNVVNVSDQLTMNKWNLVKVPVATLINDRGTLDSSKINQVWIRAAGEYEANALTLYVQNIEFCTESNVEITKATYSNGKVTLNWQSNITPANYVVKCGGEVIGTYKGTQKFVLITPNKYGTVAVYTVEALDAEGKVITESAERMLFIENKNDISANKVTVFRNSKASDTTISVLPNYGGYKAYTGTSPLGGEAMTMSVLSKATIDAHNEKDSGQWGYTNGLKVEVTGKDVSNNKIGGYLRMLVYPQTKLEAFPGKVNTAIYSKNAAGKVEQSNVIYIDGMLEMNKWNTVTIPMASLLNGSNVDISNITQIAFNAIGDYENDGDCIFYVQGIEFGITEDVHANEIAAEKSGNTVTFSAEVNNLTGSAASPAIIAAAYTADGKLESVEIFNKDSVESKNTGVVSGTFELPENTTYKAMLVYDTAAMKPITKVLAEAAE